MPPKNPAREKRLAAALRQNLRRRKEATRARQGEAKDEPDGVTEQPERVPEGD
jgi:hypothetical protein